MGAPALLDAQAARILDLLNEMVEQFRNRAVVGGFSLNALTSQATGANGALTLVGNLTTTVGVINGVRHELPLERNVTLANSVAWGAISGVSVVAATVLSGGVDNDSPSFEAVFGAVAATGSEVAPTDDEITAALGHENWLRFTDIHVDRTGDLSLSFLFDFAGRFLDGLPIASFATSEAEFNE